MGVAYHLSELAIALDANHPAHILPPPVEAGSRVLDIGCGAGQSLLAAYPHHITYGLDLDLPILQLGKTWSSNLQLCCGRAEHLPYRDETFDLVIARVSLAYTDIQRSLSEARRVLKTGARLWITLHSWLVPWRSFRQSNWKGKIYFLYVMLNGLCFHWFQKQFSLFGKQESFQTTSRMTKVLYDCGFRDVHVTRDRHFLIEAVRRPQRERDIEQARDRQ